jgi:drug/metabolite transporter (DMT)-like permease
MGPVGKTRSPWAIIGLSIITLGIYGLYWQYATFKEMKEHSNEGIGGGLALVIAIFVGFVNCFLMPSEIANLYKARGQEAPVSAVTGCWILLPIVGAFVWLFKVQGRLNDYWDATPPLTEGFAGATAPAV